MIGHRRDAWFGFGLALFVRMAVVAWAATRFPAVEDGHYYDVLARRLATGHGYTWLWPDGAVTYVAHYPVGYPALLAAAYRLFGPSTTVAMTLNAVAGALAAYAIHRLVDGVGVPRWRPLAAATAVALHPALVPYTAALMTESVTASALVIAAALVGRAQRPGKSWLWVTCVGVVMAIATLIRPQSLVLAPVFGFLAVQLGKATTRARLANAFAVLIIALACVSPWTLRNCARMGRCALVSVNGGWNLLIGATSTGGGWQPVRVPPECSGVWDEAAKDSCFEHAAWRHVEKAPLAWLALVPAKIAVTLDYFGAAPWYLHASNPAAFDDRAKIACAAFETAASRLFLLAALVACGRLHGARPLVRKATALAGAASALTIHGSLGYLAVVLCSVLLGWRALVRAPLIVSASAAVIIATVAIHGVFFGSGRYGLLVVPFVTALGFVGTEGVLCSSASTPFGRSFAPLLAGRKESPSSAEHDAG